MSLEQMSFDKLALQPSLLQGVNACGYPSPTPIQNSAIPIILAGDDLIGIAGTGTGKTAAFMLPALQHLNVSRTKAGGRRTRILVLTPTRELAEQITNATKAFAKFGDRVAISSIIGGIPYRRQAASLSPAPDIIVATPGRLIDYLQNKQINLGGVEMLILDEADRMLDMGFIDDVKRIIQTTPADCQKLMFSATFDSTIANFARTVLKNPKQVSMAKDEQNQKANIEQRIYMTDDVQHKTELLSSLLASENVYKAIIFSATKRGADKLAKQLNEQGYSASELHGNLKQYQRNTVIDNMRKDKIQFLVATDVAARGIDIAGITHVFNFDFPTYAEDYVHRIGRTGRAGKTGVAISLALRKEMRHIKQVERYTKQSLTVIWEKGTASAAPRQNANSESAFSREANSQSDFAGARHTHSRSEYAGSRGAGSRSGSSARRGNAEAGSAGYSRNANSRADFSASRSPRARTGATTGFRNGNSEAGSAGYSRNANSRADFSASRNARARTGAMTGFRNGNSEASSAGYSRNANARSDFNASRGARTRTGAMTGFRNGNSEASSAGYSRNANSRVDFAESRSTRARTGNANSRNSNFNHSKNRKTSRNNINSHYE